MNRITMTVISSLLLILSTSIVHADKSTLWTKALKKMNSFKNYELINETDLGVSEQINQLVGSRAGRDMLNSTFRVTSNSGGMVTVESSLNSPDLKGNRISTTFSSSTFSIKRIAISEKYANGGARTNVVAVMPAANYKGNSIRGLTESATSIKTSLLDGTAPLVDIVSIVYLVQGSNKQNAKILHNKPIYFYLNGLLRKARLQLAGSESIKWFGKQRKVTRFNLLRESDVMGSIWIEANGSGEPLKIKIGILNFSIKVN